MRVITKIFPTITYKRSDIFWHLNLLVCTRIIKYPWTHCRLFNLWNLYHFRNNLLMLFEPGEDNKRNVPWKNKERIHLKLNYLFFFMVNKYLTTIHVKFKTKIYTYIIQSQSMKFFKLCCSLGIKKKTGTKAVSDL